MKITIIGGYGDTGGFFAELFKKEGKVTVTGPSEEKGASFSEKHGVEYEKNNLKASRDADIVVVSVPIDNTEEVIAEVACAMKNGALLMDLTSIKEGPCKAMEENAPGGVEVIGCHPMFSHRVRDMKNQAVILTPVRGGKWLGWIRGFFEKHEAKVHETSPEEHDLSMAIVQGLTHFAYIAVGKTLKDLEFDVQGSLKYSSPVYELMLDMVGRILGQNPQLYAAIQMNNSHIGKVHEAFLRSCEELGSIVAEKNTERFKAEMRSAAENFGDVEKAMARSDKAVASLMDD